MAVLCLIVETTLDVVLASLAYGTRSVLVSTLANSLKWGRAKISITNENTDSPLRGSSICSEFISRWL